MTRLLMIALAGSAFVMAAPAAHAGTLRGFEAYYYSGDPGESNHVRMFVEPGSYRSVIHDSAGIRYEGDPGAGCVQPDAFTLVCSSIAIEFDLGDGDDSFAFGAGSDPEISPPVTGGLGNDRLEGGASSDRWDGGPGDDVMIGGDGSDWLLGGDGNDTLLGGPERDLLEGNAGNDHLDGGTGTDRLDSGGGVPDQAKDGGDDVLVLRDGAAEGITCLGADTVVADFLDLPPRRGCGRIELGDNNPDAVVPARVRSRSSRLSGKYLPVKLSCPATAQGGCAGTIAFTGARGKLRWKSSNVRHQFALGSGETTVERMRLSSVFRSSLGRAGRWKGSLLTLTADGAGNTRSLVKRFVLRGR